MLKTVSGFKGEIIRDAVHGDIFVEERFLKIMDTPEFQRLHRIRQLSTAYYVFPTAQHTRFSHSVGTYHVMNLLIDHFRPIFESINIKIAERDILLALGAALLHDIGHGPFSHAFEGALPNNKEQKKHEQWTIDIVTSRESNINRVLIENFDERFPDELADLIKKERDIKKHRQDVEFSDIDLFFIISSLISSQLDADRMDYLLRDALLTGVTYGNYDISRIISSLTITEQNDKYYVCVHEKFLSTIEDYLLARYQMHEEVYLHSFKCEMELVVKKILFRAFKLYQNKQLSGDLPDALVSIFEGKEMTVTEYISLDDSVMVALFAQWKDCKDPILALLTLSFLDRKKYQELIILNNSDSDIKEFKEELTKILKNYGYEVEDFQQECFWLETEEKNVIYKDPKDNIWIQRKNGTVCDLFEVSRIVTKALKDIKNFVFINYDIIRVIPEINDVELAIDDIKNLIKLYNNRNHIEIEKKYCFENADVFEKVCNALSRLEQYNVDESEDYIEQIDIYFDTADRMLFNSDRTLRIRKKLDDLYLTIKTPTRSPNRDDEKKAKADIQNERFEYEKQVKSDNIEVYKEYIFKYIPEIEDHFSMLEKALVIRNRRKKIKLTSNKVDLELAFDNVLYEGGVKEVHEFEIEMELKSDFLHRVNLKMLSDYLLKNIPELVPTTKSKYKRGIELTR